MTVRYLTPASPGTRHRNGTTRPKALTVPLDQPARLCIGHWLGILGISAPSFYRRLNKGLIPKPDGHDKVSGRPFWDSATVRKFLEKNT